MQTGLLSSNAASASQSASVASAVAASGGNSSPKDLFTKLLVAQIRNQNPLEPTDPAQFVGQLTQLSQMEAMQGMATSSNSQTSLLQSLQVLQLGNQVGSDVVVATDTLTLDTSKVALGFDLNSPSSQTTLVLTDEAGTEHRVELGSRSSGRVDYQLDPQQAGLPGGRYTARVETDLKEAPSIEVAGTIRSVRSSASGGIFATVDHVGDVSPLSIVGFNGRRETQSV